MLNDPERWHFEKDARLVCDGVRLFLGWSERRRNQQQQQQKTIVMHAVAIYLTGEFRMNKELTYNLISLMFLKLG